MTDYVPEVLRYNLTEPIGKAVKLAVDFGSLPVSDVFSIVQQNAQNSFDSLVQNSKDTTARITQAVTGVPEKIAGAWNYFTQEARIFSALPNDSKIYVTKSIFQEAYNAYWTKYKNTGDEKLAQEAAERAAQQELRKAQNPNPLDDSQVAKTLGGVGQGVIDIGIKIPLKIAKFAIKWGLPTAATITLSQLATGNYRVVSVGDSKDLPENARANFNIESGIPAVLIETGINGGPRSVVVLAMNPGKESKLFLPFPTNPTEAWAPGYLTNTDYATAANLGGGYLFGTAGTIPSQIRLGYYLGQDTNFGVGVQFRFVGPRVLANPISGYLLNKPEDGRQIKIGAFGVLNILPQAQMQRFINVGPLRFVDSTVTNQASGGSVTVHTGAPETGWQGANGTLGNQVSTNVGNLPGGGNYNSKIEMIQLNSGFQPEKLEDTLGRLLDTGMNEAPPTVSPDEKK